LAQCALERAVAVVGSVTAELKARGASGGAVLESGACAVSGKVQPRQSAGPHQAARGQRRVMHIGIKLVRIGGAAGRRSRAGDAPFDLPQLADVSAEHVGDAGIVIIFDARLKVAAPAKQVGAKRRAQIGDRIVATLGNAALRLDQNAVEPAVDHEVGNARDRIGAIDGRYAAGNHVDPFEQELREHVDGDQARVGAGLEPFAVEQGQRAIEPEAADVGGIGATVGAAVAAAGAGVLAHRVLEHGQLLKRGGDRCRRRIQQLLGAHDSQRGRAAVAVGDQARTGDNQLLRLDRGRTGLLVCRGGGGLGHCGTGQRKHAGAHEKRNRIPELAHISPLSAVRIRCAPFWRVVPEA